MKQLIEKALAALENHTEKTRPIERTSEVITELKEALSALETISNSPGDYAARCKGRECNAPNSSAHSPECIVDAAETQGWSDAPEAIEAANKISQAQQPTQEPSIDLNREDLNLIRQWFNAVQDFNPKYLVEADFQLLAKLNRQSPQEPTFEELTKLVMQAATREGHKVTMKISWAKPSKERGDK